MPAASLSATDTGSNATAAVVTSLNALLDDQATQVLARTHEIAERVRKLGATTLRSIGDIQRRQRLADNDVAALDARAMFDALRADNVALVASLRELKGLADVAGDNATSGLVDVWTDEAEQRAWFLREALAA